MISNLTFKPKRGQRSYSDDDKRFILSCNGTQATLEEVSIKLNRSIDSVRRKANEMGVKLKGKQKC